ncbi:MAG: hypothetical protein A2660_02430 [Candidatus Doudnabacteria bacterium RIFCSPHIGHO2_01_FULL_45_18]|uniref:NlpC/P60 domain-containing protein n=1 Tax=Candidatus Doudnabacteria bacterium RIFCSPHIGHO2_01_FULL_45_18 TaxID=1817823 RepID=A0A1F5NRB5_9BACT|nr:MAG: hypothetical protein A2660_02430 [Candidatus Doudnabacteria bacterium RIFCSPHIGHO2_01_FULL_45_18]
MIRGYMAVGNKCAVDLEELCLPISTKAALEILWQKGFRVAAVDVVKLARGCVSSSRYRRGANYFEAPFTVDCSTLTKWVYAKTGIWLPRHSIDQREMGKRVSDVRAGDLIFANGAKPYWFTDPTDGVGHVGICTGQGTVIHAASKDRGVVEDSIEDFRDPARVLEE